MLRKYSKTNYGISAHRKQTFHKVIIIGLIGAVLISGGAFINIQRVRVIKEHKNLVQLWKDGSYREVFDLSAVELEKKPLDFFLLSIHGFAAYQLAAAQINTEDMLIYTDESISALRKALLIKDNARDGRLYYVLGKAYYYKGADYAELAIKYLELALNSSYKAEDIPEYLGLSYALIHDYQKSVEAFSIALVPADQEEDKISKSDILLLSIAKSYLELGEYNSARAYLIRCLEVSRDFSTISKARLLLGNILLEEGNTEEAEKQYMAVLQEGGEQADARYQLGELYLSRGESIKARAEWRKAVRIDPAYGPALAKLRM
ncbi:hypothetical protein AGMMS50212_08700 [Spirochaetia bacterium]|nr:hypothetical protein AGMMS50212_08620 [Spirochaetia bacterium]GHV83530.1 hypothetical protein AGMMS50212_08700 [Spirochaetia bacterium]